MASGADWPYSTTLLGIAAGRRGSFGTFSAAAAVALTPMTGSSSTLRLGTRGSLLARAQSQLVASELSLYHAGLRVELVTIRTTGDRITDRPLHNLGGKGLFTKELEQALLAREIDFAVHSFKDVPVTMPLVDTSDLVIAAVPARVDPRDAIAVRDLAAKALPRG